jgi:penicillin-binding protein 2
MLQSKNGLENKKIKKLGDEIELEEIVQDVFIQKKEGAVFQKKIEVPLRPHAIKYLWFVFFVLSLFVLVKTFQFQFLEYDKFFALAQKNKFVTKTIQAQRGVIYDRNFHQLVINKPSFNLIVEKDRIPDEIETRERVLEKIAWILDIEKQEIEQEIANHTENRFTMVRGLDYEKLILLESSVEEINGFSIQNVGIREYKEGPSFSHIIGYFRDGGSNAGLEDLYNDFLNSESGKIKYERDVFGNIISEEMISLPESGNSLVLWLDADLQKKLYETMAEYIKGAEVKRAAAVAIDPKTGGILALVSFPSFDNNLFTQGMNSEQWDNLSKNPDMPLLNRVISGKYATGSTIKPLIAAGALQEGIVSEKTTINCKGEIIVENPWFEDKPFIYKDWMTHGITDIKKAIAQSCNVFFYTIGGGYKDFKGLGVEKIKKYLEFFGWGEILGIDLPGEVKGFIPGKEWKREKFTSPNDIWMPGDTYHLSIGQGFVSVTPLEVASSFVAIANNGKLFKPQIVQKIVDKDKNVIKEFESIIIRQDFIDKKNLEIIREGMRGTVTYGSAVILNNLPVTAAAKTGTAEIGKKDYYHSWMTVFAPYEDPEIVLTLIVEDAFGMHVAVAPTARDVLNWYFGGDEIKEGERE